MRSSALALAFASTLLATSVAHAQEAPEPVPAPRAQARHVSATISPLHLVLPIIEATVEARLAAPIGLAVIGGYGSVRASSSTSDKLRAYELGSQLRGYLMDDFKGLHLGAELLYVHLDTSSYEGSDVSAFASGVAIGPFGGYKLVTSGGFTFDAQLGVQHISGRAKATSSSSGSTGTAEGKSWIPLLNLNIGWTF